MYEEMDEVVRGVGQVCISATSLEWSLAFCTCVVRGEGNEWLIQVCRQPGQPLKMFRKLVRTVAIRMPELGADTKKLLADAEQLLEQRHRVVHSAMAGELEPGSRLHGAWHARTDTTWPIIPAELNDLARDLALCAREVDAFGTAWEERAERDGWPDLEAISSAAS
jgi:hypothetical protein